MHVLVTQVQKNDSLFTLILLPFQCCLLKVCTPAPCHHCHLLAVCPLQCMLFICTAINPKKEKDLLLLPHFSWIHCLRNKKESTFCCLKWEIFWFWRWSFASTFKLNGSVMCSVKTHTLESALKFGIFFSKILNSHAWIGFYCTIDIDLNDITMFSVV